MRLIYGGCANLYTKVESDDRLAVLHDEEATRRDIMEGTLVVLVLTLVRLVIPFGLLLLAGALFTNRKPKVN